MVFNQGLLKDKVALVTGGGSGIGKEIARLYLKLGAEVYITGRKADKLETASQELDELGNIQFKTCDIREPEEIEALSHFIKEKSGSLDILVNNAGGQFPTTAESLNKKGWDAVIRNNLNGTWYMTHAMASEFFIPQKRGNIINIIINIYRGMPGMIHSGAARAGVDNITKTLAVEWSKYHININAVAPGLIMSTGFEQYPKELTDGIAAKVPLKRLGTTGEVADLVGFLSTPAASYITGETIYIDGGWRLHGDVFEL